MACGHGGRKKRIGRVVMNLRIWSWLGVSQLALGLRGVFTRVRNAGFFLRISDQSLFITHI